MNHDEFIGEVQHRAQLSSRGDADAVTRTVLTTLSERIQPGEADDLAAQLPEEIGRYLTEVEDVESFSFDEFVDRVVEREGLDPEDEAADAAFHAQVVIDVVSDVVSQGEMDDVRPSLPDDYDELFELADQAEGPG